MGVLEYWLGWCGVLERTVGCKAEHDDGKDGLDCAQGQDGYVEERHLGLFGGVTGHEQSRSEYLAVLGGRRRAEWLVRQPGS